MADWQVGDLALCIDDGPPRDICGNGGVETKEEYIAALRVGAVYTVNHVVVCTCGKRHIGIGEYARRVGGSSDRFVKVTPGADIEGVEVERRVPTKERA